MFVDCQNFAGSLGNNFTGYWFMALQFISLLNVPGKVNLWVRVTHEMHKH